MSILVQKREAAGDRRVWVKADNGVTCVRWRSLLENRNDVQIICDYKEGDQFPGHIDEEVRKIEIEKAAAKMVAEKEAKEEVEAEVKPKRAPARAKATKG